MEDTNAAFSLPDGYFRSAVIKEKALSALQLPTEERVFPFRQHLCDGVILGSLSVEAAINRVVVV